ncbi:hypothetical protein V8F33_005496 [Rhypophila sp. PSN 637]
MASPMEAVSLEWCVNDVLKKRDKVDTLLDKVLELDRNVRVIEENQLESLDIRRLASLDLEQGSIDLEPIYFHPLPANFPSWGEFFSDVQGQRREGRRDDCICRWYDACRGEGIEDHDLCAGPYEESRSRLGWFLSALRWAGAGPDAVGYLEKNTDWRLCLYVPAGDYLLCRRDDILMLIYMFNTIVTTHATGNSTASLSTGVVFRTRVGEHFEEDLDRYQFEYDLEYCFIPTEELDEVSAWAPRIKGAVIQSHKARGDTLLRSELHSALHLLIHMLEHGLEDYHHTIPVLIYSFHHDKTARVTQFHFNGEHLFFRQSRLLDLAADEPTEDAYLLLRWMASLPVGETTFTALNELVESQTIDTDDGGEKGILPISPRPKSTRDSLSVGA